MTIRVATFGGLHVNGESAELDVLLGRRLRAALFVFLAIERRVTRASLATIFWPERDEEQARHALRQSIYDLRKVLGTQWLATTAHELRASPELHTDVFSFSSALERNQPESAARLYAGPFLAGVHLVDQKPWESWVDTKRAEYTRAFRRACREWLEAKRAAGDLAGALEAAQHWVGPDPLDDEAQHRLIEVLAQAGERTEAIRQFEAFTRLLEAEGLRPLDDTLALLERTRAELPAWPELTNGHNHNHVAAQSGEPVAVDLPQPVTPANSVLRPGDTRRADRKSFLHSRRRSHVFGAAAAVLLVSALLVAQPGWFRWPGLLGRASAHGAGSNVERLVLADFQGPNTDPQLGAVVTEALRADLRATRVLHLVDPSEVAAILRQMRAPHGSSLKPEGAREVALRAGAGALLTGAIAQFGSRYVLTAVLRSVARDSIVAAFKETAQDEQDVIDAIDRLSRRIRRSAGESLQSIDAAPALGRVTTASLDALRLYTTAEQAAQQRDHQRALSLLEEATALDPEFAMAWRLMAAVLSNTRTNRARESAAARRAYELRDRLSPRERYLATAQYHSRVTHNHQATIDAYRQVLELEPNDRIALNNLGLLLHRSNDDDAAAALMERLVNRPGAGAVNFINLLLVHIAQGRWHDAQQTMNAFAAAHPDNPELSGWRFWVDLLTGDLAAARMDAAQHEADPRLALAQRSWAFDNAARLALWQGRIRDARRQLEMAEHVARDAGTVVGPLVWRLRRAYVEALLGDADQAVRLLNEIREEELFPRIAPAERYHFMQALILGLAGRIDQADAILREFNRDLPHELRLGHRTQIEAARAVIQLRRGNAQQAVLALQQLRASHPCQACFASRMGWALREAGRIEEAAREWETALAWQDNLHDLGVQLVNHLWTLQNIPAVYEQLGDTARAIEHYQRLTQLWRNADPELQPRVRHAQQRLKALQQGMRP